MNEALRLSNLDLVKTVPTQSAAPLESIFGPPPEPDWCYYYEQADLARQLGDWPRLASLADSALALQTRLYEVNAPELVAFIEGYARTGAWDQAMDLSRKAYTITPRMERMLCDTWGRILENTPDTPQRQQVLNQLASTFTCP